jgi:tetratricopeptide (TPR) repeat protein
MTNSADLLLFKAAQLLERDQDVEGALEALHEALVLTQIAEQPLQLIRTKTLLGELLAQIEQPGEALKEFRDVVRLAGEYQGDVSEVAEEAAAAREWVAKLEQGH